MANNKGGVRDSEMGSFGARDGEEREYAPDDMEMGDTTAGYGDPGSSTDLETDTE